MAYKSEKLLRFIKKMKGRPPQTDGQGFKFTVEEMVSMHRGNMALMQTFGRPFGDDLLKYKKSDTLFILGSGPSINKLSQEQLAEIKRHDSIGFNFWIAHDLIPSMYMFQIPIYNRESFLNLFKDRHHLYENVPFIIRGSALAQNEMDFKDVRLTPLLEKEAYLLNEYPISSKCSIDIETLIEYVDILGIMNYGKLSHLVPKWRGTLGLIISLAYQMGYKKIVLCGADMMDNRHFWDDPQWQALKAKYGLTDGSNVANKIMYMVDDGRSPNTVPAYIYALRKWMKEQNGVEIYTARPETVLYPDLPLYPFGAQA